ncbi:MAG: DUF4235 domain-containing protein [Actinobacteria bacterium]|nr:DUF4235 domain-containing protein [Actinomycetota bacterium]
MGRELPQPDGSIPEEPTGTQMFLAAVGGVLAAKLSTRVVTYVWRNVTGEDVPKVHQQASTVKKLMWLAVAGVVSGSARQVVRDWIKPVTVGPA